MSQQEWLQRLGNAIDGLSIDDAGDRDNQRVPAGESTGATVLFAEITGMDDFPDDFDKSSILDIQKLLKNLLTNTIARYGGRVEQVERSTVLSAFCEGDEADHAINALSAASEFFDSLRSLASIFKEKNLKSIGSRMGIHTGTVIRQSEFDAITGEIVQVSARLRKQTENNAIIISSPVQMLAGDRFSYQSHGGLTIKGHDASLKIFEVLNRKPEIDQWEHCNRSAQTPFVGRDDELECLKKLYGTCLAAAVDNESKKHVMAGITGPAGIGKSRLANRFLSSVVRKIDGEDSDRVTCKQVLTNGISGYHRRPMGALTAMLLNCLRHPDSKDEIETRLDEMISDLINYSTQPEEFNRSKAMLAYLLGVENSDLRIKHLNSLALQTEIFFAFCWLVGALAQKVYQTGKLPLIMVWERYRKMDDSSQDALRFLLKNIKTPLPMMIIVIFRPGGKLPEMTQRFVEKEKLILESLSYANEKAMITSLLGNRPVSPRLESMIQTMGKGHPYYIEELVHMIRKNSIIEFADNQWKLKDEDAEETLPQTLQEIVNARIELLDSKFLDILQFASVIGPRFDFESLRKIAHRVKGEHDIQGILSNLVSFHYIQPDGISGDLGDNYRFSFRFPVQLLNSPRTNDRHRHNVSEPGE